MSLPEPRANPALVGHDDAARALAAAARAGRLHHAWLITGPPGVGKATLAFRFARWMLAGLPPDAREEPPLFVPPEAPGFRRAAAGSHPDLFTLEPSAGQRGVKEVLRVEEVREAIRFLAHTAAEGGWRAVVVDRAERADTAAVQNTLLKTLEEPPPRAVLLLTTHQPDRLLPTVRSRCRRLDLFPLAEPDMDRLLAEALPETPAADRAGLARLAEGSPGAALALAEEGGLALQGLVDRVLSGLPRLDPRLPHAVADGITGRKDAAAALSTFFALLRRALAATVRAAGRGEGAAAWVAARSLAEWAVLWDRLGRLADETERLNLDRRQAVLTGLSWLSAAPR